MEPEPNLEHGDLLERITQLHLGYIDEPDPRKFLDVLLSELLQLTRSEYGFIGEVFKDVDGAPYLKTHAITNIAWNDETRAFYEANAPTGLEFTKLDSLFGRVLTSGEALIANEPSSDPRRGGLPGGHPPLNSFVGVPLLNNKQMVGMVGMANRSGGYSEALLGQLEPMWTTASAMLKANIQGRAKNAAEEERRVATERLRGAERMETVGQLAGGIAHDMNNLLIAIMGNAELVCSSLDGEQLDRDMMREDLEQVLLAGNRAAALTNQLLTFSRRKIIRTRPIQLGEVALALQELLRRLIRENIALEVDVSPGLPSVKADTSMMNQVVLNLVMNARDAIEGPGEIRIRVQNLPEDRVALSVTDSGCGMTDEERERATELFFTTKHLGAGTGLGLATVKRIINQSSGELRIESTPGEGSTFTVLLPAFHGPASPVDEDRTGGTEGGSETLLVCEDDLVVLEFIRRALEPEGYVVLSANTASIASEKAASSPRLDLLLTDIVLPQSSGPEVAARLQVHHPDLGVIFMSGYGGTDLGGAIQDDVAFLQKPFNKASLLRTVRDVLNARAR